jgi:hypothetical protein
MDIEQHFDEIVQSFLIDMARVKCSVEDYKAGLRGAVEQAQVALQAAEEMG